MSNIQTTQINGVDIAWNKSKGTFTFFDIPSVLFWINPSLLSMLKPLADMVGHALFRLEVANSASHGTNEDYNVMITVLGKTFEDGFLNWGKAVSSAGWGTFEFLKFDPENQQARVRVCNTWELLMQAKLPDRWGCPFIQGKLIGIFSHAFDTTCWADEVVTSYDADNMYVEFEIYRSDKTIEQEIANERLAHMEESERKLALEVERKTTDLNALNARLRSYAEELRQNEERYRSLFDNAVEAILVFNPKTQLYVDANPMAEHVFGYTREQFLTMSPVDLIWSDDPSQVRQALLNHVERVLKAEHIRFIPELKHASGRTVWCDARISLLPSTGGNLIRASFNDITERKLLEEQLAHTQKLETIGRLTGGIAHDFNNLLQIIQINLDLHHHNLGDNHPASRLMLSAMGACKRANALTQQLLAFSHKQALNPELFDPEELISTMHALLGSAIGSKITLEISSDDHLPQVFVDPNSLQNAILNLTLNATAAMPQGGEINITTKVKKFTHQTIIDNTTLPVGSYVEISLSDTGHGMTPEVLKHAIEPFFTTKDIGEGSGLGLSMVYGFAGQSGGTLQIVSEPGKGTTVSILLPEAQSENPG